MNKKELIEAICEMREENIEAVGQEYSWAYDYIFAVIIKAVAQGENVVISDFGIFYPQIQHSNCKQILVKKTVPGFIPDLCFKDAVARSSKQ